MTLLELFELVRKRLPFVLLLTILCGVLTGLYMLTRPTEYTAQTTMYVLSRQANDETDSWTQQELSAGQMLTNDVATIVRSDRVKREVAQACGLEDLSGYKLSVTNTTTTRVITLSVTGHDPEETVQVANAYVKVVSRVASEVMNIQSVNVIDAASTAEKSGPRRTLITLGGLLAGAFLSLCIIVLSDVLNVRVRDDHDVEELLGLPVMGHFPRQERG